MKQIASYLEAMVVSMYSAPPKWKPSSYLLYVRFCCWDCPLQENGFTFTAG